MTAAPPLDSQQLEMRAQLIKAGVFALEAFDFMIRSLKLPRPPLPSTAAVGSLLASLKLACTGEEWAQSIETQSDVLQAVCT